MFNTSFSTHRNKYFITLAALSLALVFLSAQRLMAEDTEQVIGLEQEACECLQQQDYIGARDKFRQVVKDHPTAIVSQGGLIKALVYLEDFTTAEAETNKLLSDYPDHPEFTGVARDVAVFYRRTKHYPQAVQLYQAAVNKGGDATDMIWCQRGLALSQIGLGDFAAADITTNKLVSDYSTDPNAVVAIRQVADFYRSAKRHTKAVQLYLAVMPNSSNAADMIWCQRGQAISQIELENFTAADAAADKLLSDYSNYPEFARAARDVARHYLGVKHYSEAVQLYQAVINKGADATDMIWCLRGVALSQIELENYTAADAAASKRASDYSNHPEFARAARDVAVLYHRVKHYPQAVQLYQAVVNKGAAPRDMIRCLQGLACSQIQLSDFEAADAAVDTLLSNYSNDPGTNTAIRQIAAYYRGKKRDADAELLYETIANNGSAGVDIIWSQCGLARSQIRQRDYAMADATINQLLSDYSAHPDIPKAVREAADCYRDVAEDYTKAMQLYETVVDSWPNTADMIWCQRGLACAQIKQGNLAAANSIVDTLLSDDSANPKIARVIRQIADHYRSDAKDYAKATQLYQTAIDKGGDILCWRGLACSQIGQADITAADATINTLLTEYVSDPEIARVIREIGLYCRSVKKDEKALALYQTALSLNPSKKEQNNAHACIACIYLSQGDEAAVRSKIDLILSNHTEPDDAGMAVFVISEGYYLEARNVENKATSDAYYQKAVELIEKNALNLISENNLKSSAYYVLGLNYRKLKDDVRASQAFANSYQYDPGFKHADYCLYAQGECYLNLIEEKKVASEAEARSTVNQVFSELISKYPKSSYVSLAKWWLKKN